MENNLMKQFIEILRNDHDKAFDFIANNAWQFSKDELRNICKELVYGIYKSVEDVDQDSLFENVADELFDWYSED